MVLRKVFKPESPFSLRDRCQDTIHHTSPDHNAFLLFRLKEKTLVVEDNIDFLRKWEMMTSYTQLKGQTGGRRAK